MQRLASSRGPVPNVFTPFLGDYGTLVIFTQGKWHVRSSEWRPDHGYTKQEFLRHFRCAPPSNVQDGWWGIVLIDVATDANWTAPEIQAALDQFVGKHAGNYQQPAGKCMEPLKKGTMLGRIEQARARIAKTRHIYPAPRERVTADQSRM